MSVRARPSSGTLTQDEFARRWPRLYHMAQAGSRPSIKRHGLLSTTALLDHFGVIGNRRAAIEATRRSEPVLLTDGAGGEAWIRDNKPITPATLRRHLLGMAEGEWYRELNSRVFFWLIPRRLEILRQARA